MKLRKIAVAALSALGLTAASLAMASPAEAAGYSFANNCNSSASDEWIEVWDYGDPQATGWFFRPGACAFITDINIPNTRVDVDTTQSFDNGVDVDSYKIGHIDYGYGPCHDGETDSSNPDDDYADTGYRYHNYTNSGC